MKQHPHRNSIVVWILCLDWNQIQHAGGGGVGHAQLNTAIVIVVLYN